MKVQYSEFDITKLMVEDNVPKTYTATSNGRTSTGTYHEFPITYNYGTKEEPKTSKLFIELPELTSEGIADGMNDYSLSMKLIFDMDKTKFDLVSNSFDGLYKKVVAKLKEKSASVGLHSFDPENPESVIRYPLYYPRSKTTGEIIKGWSPSMYVKLLTGKMRSIFAVPRRDDHTKLEIISTDVLKNKEIKLVPLLYISHVYCNGKSASIQVKVSSAIVTSIKEKSTVELQADTMQRIVSERPEVVAKVNEHLDLIRKQIAEEKEKADEAEAAKPPTKPKKTRKAKKSKPKRRRRKHSSSESESSEGLTEDSDIGED